jgi:S1-C subfamily serine protease
VNLLDLLLVGLLVAGVVGGYRLGFVTRVTSWIGLVAGLVLAVALVDPIVSSFDDATSTTLLLVAAGIVFVGAFGGQALGLAIGNRYRPVRAGTVRRTDRFAGAAIGAVGVLALIWLLVPVIAATPGWPAELAPRSVIARAVHDALPEPPDAVQALQALVGDDLPRVFDDLRPTPDVGPPPASSGLTQEVTDAVVPSVVKVEGEACGRIQDGSGFVVAPGLVVTNAHVVAGEERSDVLTSSGERLPGVAVAFDPDRDLAVLSVAGLEAPGLPLADAAAGDIGGVFGFPGGGDLRIAPFSVVREIRALGRDIYDDGRTEREVLELASDLAPGDSGSALVAPDGTVVGVAFAIAPDRPDVAYALTVDELETVLAGDLTSAVSTGPCI